MNSLDFLYIALGIGFNILVIFVSVLIVHLVLVLRDVTKITGNFKDASDRLREVVLEPMKTLSEMSAGFGIVHDFIEKIRAKQSQAAEEDFEEEQEENAQMEKEKADSRQSKKSKNAFSIKKLRR